MPPIPENLGEKAEKETPVKCKPYISHKLQLKEYGSEMVGDCPFCDKAKKFYIAAETGQWQCKVCGASGNGLTFIRTLHERSSALTIAESTVASDLSTDRKLLSPETLLAWGCSRSIVDGTWMLPGYDVVGKLMQLYRYTKMYDKAKNRWSSRLLATSGIWPDGKAHGFHTCVASYNPAKMEVDVFEGPWDGAAYWEIASRCRWQDGSLVRTSNESLSLAGLSNIIAAPGANVFRQEWVQACRGKTVRLWYDSDHPIERGGKILRAGWDGMERIAAMLKGVARELNILRWGIDGFDPELKDGFDVRDWLSMDEVGDPSLLSTRMTMLEELYKKLIPAPQDWQISQGVNGRSTGTPVTQHVNGTDRKDLEALYCDSWSLCEGAWKEAMQWRQTMGDVLAVMLAVAGSTQQAGNQLFLQVIGDAGSGKTQMCDGLIVSLNCHALEHLTGFHSGFKMPGGEAKDCSLIARINGKTLVTPEGDVLLSSPRFVEIMSQQRRIFDGTSGATYKNSDVDVRYVGLRTPWIMAGTPALMDTDQSRLGDRFLRIIINPPMESEKRLILRKALQTERRATIETALGTAGSSLDPKMRKAQSLTGGYVDWLRANIADLLPVIQMSTEAEDFCIDLAELTADLRARPNTDPKKHEVHDTKELPTRITRQLCRLALCLSVVRNKKEVDPDILRIVKKVALDTASGKSLTIVQYMCGRSPKTGTSYQDSGGIMPGILSAWMHLGEEKLLGYLGFMKKIGVVEHVAVQQSRGYWRLTDRVFQLYQNINKVIR